tara:strand:- start:37 stop:261 length:225 start_codon:yes stop_codon:yes gene_type:complete
MENEYTLDYKPNAFYLFNNNQRTEIIISMSEAFEWSTKHNCMVTKAANSRMGDWIDELQRLKPKNPIPAKGLIR